MTIAWLTASLGAALIHRARLRRLALVCALLLIPATASAQTTFQTFGVLPGATHMVVHGMSDDGSTVVGHSLDASEFPRRAWVWTSTGGLVELAKRPEHTGTTDYEALGVSPDGSFIVGSGGTSGGFDRQGLLWTNPATAPTVLGPTHAVDVSSDGSVVAGYELFGSDDGDAWRWTSATGAVDLTDPVVPPCTLLCEEPVLATAITDDGSIIFGSYSARPMSWTGTTPGVVLELAGQELGYVHAASGSGSVQVGIINFPFGTSPGVAWISGVPFPVHTSGGLDFAFANGVSASGHRVVGNIIDFFDPQDRAFVWSTTHGNRDLTDLATLHGAGLGGLRLEFAEAVSSTGLTYAGHGRTVPGAPFQSWTLTLPAAAFPAPPMQQVNTLPLWAFALLGTLLAALLHVERRRQ